MEEEEDLILIQLNLKTKQYLNLDPRHDLYNLRSLLMETTRVGIVPGYESSGRVYIFVYF